MEAVLTPSAAPLGLIEKTRIVAAVGAAALLLYTAGWMVAEPTDPSLAVTFVRSGRAVPAVLSLWLVLALLSVVAGIIGTVIAGRRLPEAGVFAAAIGLAALSLHGGSMEVMLANEGATTTAARQTFMEYMALDCLLWSVILAATWIAVTWAYRWVWANDMTPALANPAAGVEAPTASPKTRSAPGREPASSASPLVPRAGWTALIITGVVGLFVVWLTVARTPVANIHRGQTIAAVAGGLYLGALAARYFTGIAEVRWYVLAVPLVGLVAFLVGYLSSDMSWAQGTRYQYYIYLATTPTHDLARPLPIEYVAVGTAAVLAGFWGGHKMEQVASLETV